LGIGQGMCPVSSLAFPSRYCVDGQL
jgi:hypothetical protein